MEPDVKFAQAMECQIQLIEFKSKFQIFDIIYRRMINRYINRHKQNRNKEYELFKIDTMKKINLSFSPPFFSRSDVIIINTIKVHIQIIYNT
jgi:hypothetical protein